MIPPLRTKIDARRGAVVTTAIAMSAVLASAGAAPAAVPATAPTVESTTERVLQSVDVSMAPDGTTTGVGSSVVRTDGSVEDAETSDDAYSPTEVVGDLPVRVLTSWRTSEGAGTDLSDLNGYSGRIAIDVTVQNLTVKPQMLSYDSAASSRQQAALVGSPLTVTASTGLGDLKADRVVTDDEGTGANVTNGVLGEGTDGTTVQWAALLAPPILSSASEFSLVVDAKDFDVPTFDLSVQPGLVTDPSMGALVDAAFNPANSSELELQQRTIELIGDVNEVLARASSTITDVRTSLTDTAETLGTQTVADLQSSTESVTANMSSLDGALQSLRGDLNSTLESTGSSAVAEMDQAVQSVDSLLGDTSAQPPQVEVRSDGCATVPPNPKQGGSVFGNLLQVAGQLNAYAEANGKCKDELQNSIGRTIGPDDPKVCDRENDGKPKSVTCALYESEKDFGDAADRLRAELLGGEVDGKTVTGVIEAIEPELYEDAAAAADEMTTLVTKDAGIKKVTLAIRERRDDISNAISGSIPKLEGVRDSLELVQTAIGSLRPKAEAVRDQLTDIQSQTQTAADEVCELVTSGTLTFAEAKDALSLLVSEASPNCLQGGSLTKDADDNPLPYTPIKARLGEQATVLTQGLDDSADAQAQVASALQTVNDTIEVLKRAQVTNGEQVPGGPTDPDDTDLSDEYLKQLFVRLVGENGEAGLLGELDTQGGLLGDEIEKIKDLDERVDQIEIDINAAIDRAKGNAGTGVGGGIASVLEAKDQTNLDLETMFNQSASGMRRAAGRVETNSRKSINQQKSDFFSAQKQASNRISGTIEDGLSQVSTGVSSSTRDMKAATSLLTADLRRVLLDLGQRREGGGGLLGAMATNAATASTADVQLAQAGNKANSYANVRGSDVDGIRLRQEQTEAAMQMLLEMPAFQLELPSGSQHRTVYSYTIGDS